MSIKKKIAILGSTGSIGRQCLDVISSSQSSLEIVLLMTGGKSATFLDQLRQFQPEIALLGRDSWLESEVENFPSIKLMDDAEFLQNFLKDRKIDLCINALPSIHGYKASMACLQTNTNLALANKETYLLLGDNLSHERSRSSATIIPLDSEMLAIFQCLKGEKKEEIKNVYLTASGGPLLHSQKDPESITTSEVLDHPVWRMGDKISVDSATMMNKAFEAYAISQHFELPIEQVRVLIHPQARVHSMIRFVDGHVKMIASNPDMRHSISYALHHPHRSFLETEGDLFHESWNFQHLEKGQFPIFDLAMNYLKKGGTYPAMLAIIDDFMVGAFLENEIQYQNFEFFLSNALIRANQGTHVDLHSMESFVKNCQDICRGLLEKVI